ncbi:MAG: AAA family ATPase [Synechococcaceae cyanobacterium]|nr:AAA family ATPase [Synechococcaceae cyanobacterium]
MRLLRCQLQNVRIHGDLTLDFAPGLTLIGGANESGKSTLVEALHRALFLKASATGAPVEALRSSRHLGVPQVQLGFQARGDSWILRKRFSGASGQVSLAAEGAGRSLQGPAAEDELARLLGVAEMVGSKQAKTVLPQRWAHLWVFQGGAGDNPLQAGKASYDADTLLAQLERSGGAVLQQSPRDQQVMQRLQDALDATYSARGLRKHSPLWQRQQELQAASQALDAALERLQAYEQAAERLERLETELERLQSRELPALQEQQRQRQAEVEALSRLQQRIDLAQQGLDPIRLRHDAADNLLREGDALALQIRDGQQRLLDLEQAEQRAREQEQQLLAALEENRCQRERLDAQRQQLEPRQQLLADLLDQARLNDDRQRLTAALEQQRQRAATRLGLERQLAALAPLDRAGLQRLRLLQQRWRDGRTRQEALAAGVTLLRADQPVRLDGAVLAAGEQRLLSSVFELQVGDGVALQIRPGGGQALEELQQQCQRDQAALGEALARLRLSCLDEAERLLEQRSQLEQQLAALSASANAAAGCAADADLTDQLQALQARAADLERRLLEQGACRQAWEAERGQPLPAELVGLQPLQRQLGETVVQLGRAQRQAETERQQAQADLERFRAGRRQQELELPTRRTELSERQQRLTDLLRQFGSREALAEQVARERQQLMAAEQDLQQLQQERLARAGGDPARALQQLQSASERARQQLEHLLDQRGAAKHQCDSISREDPHAAVEQARVQLEAAETAHRRLQQICEAQQELARLFEAAVSDLSSRYSDPLARSIDRYLESLDLGPTQVKLRYDQVSGFHGLELRRGADFFPHDQLSGGMREQLAAALRLAMADVLRQAHEGCLPLVFDDAFTNADPARIDGVKRMLAAAVERGLQVILLTCDPASYGGVADRCIELPLPAV